MASGGGGGSKRCPKKQPTPEELAEELVKLRMENKALKSKLKEHVGDDDVVLTQAAKEAMVGSVVSGLTRSAAKQIEERIRKETLKATTKNEFEEVIKTLSFRVSLSYADLGGRASSDSSKASKPRGRSKHRAEKQ
ncbi:virion protein G52 [Equid gammaherpesvirus 2]|uniref:Gene 52 protein n=1 Tax=Equine herpesvirus 2 (strain 86/87) TaxID=82831 RepID=VG52_EHV2|nr:virion protein G52 [Equid gammaherpesvirus 2]Q66654.1 RecName: Full=Gene 52 protein [Equid herpesvirus type 2 strain 86/87]AAC13840.1 virion protein G52 [Equid gammaherpesvirus 2]UTM05143.1 virion protein G52 [Equid gammaherpesvirus 2]UTM05298.1 virion protein G52 [Equid gammaherpesvirus 2]UTM05377.1 virion protein G52 [Equid gammaherpesvirus 2]